MDPNFVELTSESLAALYRLNPEYRKVVIKNTELLREALIEEALEKSDYHEANELIEWVKNGRQES
jgi:hypothetical protein